MTHTRTAAFALAAALLLAPAGVARAAEQAAPPADATRWAANYATAAKTAKSEGKPLLVVFYTTWCTYCAKMHHKTLEAPEVKTLLGRYVTVMVDAEVDLVAAKRFRPVGFPVVVVVDPAGREVVRFMGYKEPADFARALGAVTERMPEFSRAAAEVDAAPAPERGAALTKLGDFYASTGFPADALEQYRKSLKLAGKKGELREPLLARAAEAARLAGEAKDATRYYEDLLREYPSGSATPAALLGLGQLAVDAGHPDQAKSRWQRVVSEFPNTPQATEAAKLLGGG